jgi:hypothetical protein
MAFAPNDSICLSPSGYFLGQLGTFVLQSNKIQFPHEELTASAKSIQFDAHFPTLNGCAPCSSHFLNNPAPSQTRSSQEICKSKPGIHSFLVSKRARNHAIEKFEINNARNKLHSPVTRVRRIVALAKPDAHVPGLGVYVQHLRQLVAFLNVIVLVNANSIYPEPKIPSYRSNSLKALNKFGWT